MVIPARYASSRLPGKPLRELCGKTMIEWVWKNAQGAGDGEVIVATDDQRIQDAVEAFGGDACLTHAGHQSGTDRLAEVARLKGWSADAVVVNLQGDEPTIGAALLQLVARTLVRHPEAGIATLATPVTSVDELFDPNVVKTVLSDRGEAHYFSRAPIPWPRGSFEGGKRPVSLPDGTFLRHIGVYAYRVETLLQISEAPACPHERAESLEQLRALAMGIRIQVALTAGRPIHGVDTEEDLRRASAVLKQSGANRESI